MLPKKTTPKSQKPNTQSRKGNPLSISVRLTNLYLLVSQFLVLILGLASIFFPTLYYRAVLIAAALHFVALFQYVGRPKLNAQYAEQLFRDENSLIGFQTLILFLGPPSILFINPNLLRAAFMGPYLLDKLLEKSQGLGNKVYTIAHPHLEKIIRQAEWFNSTTALLEVCVGIYLIVCIFFMKGALLTVFLYWQILGTKYAVSPNTRIAFAHVNSMVENNLQRIPAVLNIYRKLTGYLYSMVDPQQLAARQGQAGNRRCVIM